jgi:hypothetical protein
LLGYVIKQQGFTHTRLAMEDEGPALTSADSADQLIQHVSFTATIRQPGRT